METWIYFVLMAYSVWSFTSVIDKIVISKGYIKNPLVYIVLNGLMNVLLVFLLPFAGFGALKFADLLVAVAYGIFFSAGIAVYYKAVEYDEISKIIMLNQLTPIFTFGISFLFLGEILARRHLAGFLMWIIAGLIVSYKPRENRVFSGHQKSASCERVSKKTSSLAFDGFFSASGKSFKLSRAVCLMIVSTFLIAVAMVASKHVFTVTGFWSAFLWLRLASFSAVFVLLFPSVRNDFAQTFKTAGSNAKKLLLFKMAIDFSAFILLGYAITKGPISLITALSNAVWPVFVFILALIFSIFLPSIMKEDISKKSILAKSAAVVLILMGVYFVNF